MGELNSNAVKVLRAVIDGARTVEEVAGVAKLRPSSTYRILSTLRHMGLIGWADGASRTIHPLVTEIPMGRPQL